jgi:SAM-dependent methyltransferase
LSGDDIDPRGTLPPRVQDEWYVGFHRGLAARFWRAVGATMADDDARLIHALLGGERCGSVLDVPCGDGRIAIRLAAYGHAVTGVDLAAGEVERARRAAEEAGVRATFVVGDLRALPDVGPVDAVVSWGNSFGYLTPADTAESLAGMHRALRRGGRLVLESMTIAESLLARGVSSGAVHEFGGVRMTSTHNYRAEESRLETDYVLEDEDGRVERARAAHHVHTAGEVVRLLRAAGFRDAALLGPDGTSAYALGDPKLVAVATA